MKTGRLCRPLAAAISVLVAAGLLSACSAPPTLVESLADRMTPSWGGAREPESADRFGVQLGAFICSVRPTEVSVALEQPSAGLHLVAYRIENANIDMNADQSPRSFSPRDSHVVRQRCGRAEHYSRVDLDLHRTRPGTQGFAGVRIAYSSGGRTKIGYVPVSFRFTDPAGRTG